MGEPKEIKCEFTHWKEEKELKTQAAEARREAEIYKMRFDRSKAFIAAAVVIIIIMGIIAIVNSKDNTAAEATAAILTEYEKEFKAETGTEERIEIAEEIDRLFKSVDLDDLPEKNAEFLEACRMITKQLGSTEVK